MISCFCSRILNGFYRPILTLTKNEVINDWKHLWARWRLTKREDAVLLAKTYLCNGMRNESCVLAGWCKKASRIYCFSHINLIPCILFNTSIMA